MQIKKALVVGGVLLAAHLYLRAQRKKEPTINYVERIPLGFNAITIPPIGIFIGERHMQNEALLKHELVHWRQYQRMGLVPYYYNYVRGMVINGYDLHPMEMEARQNENPFCRANYTECVRNGTALTVYDPNFRKAS